MTAFFDAVRSKPSNPLLLVRLVKRAKLFWAKNNNDRTVESHIFLTKSAICQYVVVIGSYRHPRLPCRKFYFPKDVYAIGLSGINNGVSDTSQNNSRRSNQELQKLRSRAINLVEYEKQPVTSVAKELGVSRQVIYKWLKLYDQQWKYGVNLKRMGRPRGTKKLSPSQQQEIKHIISNNLPDDRVMNYAKHLSTYGCDDRKTEYWYTPTRYDLWSIDSVSELIRQKLNICIDHRAVERMLWAWEFIPKLSTKYLLHGHGSDYSHVVSLLKMRDVTDRPVFYLGVLGIRKKVPCHKKRIDEPQCTSIYLFYPKKQIEFICQDSIPVTAKRNTEYYDIKRRNEPFRKIAEVLRKRQLQQQDQDPWIEFTRMISPKYDPFSPIVVLDRSITRYWKRWRSNSKKLKEKYGVTFVATDYDDPYDGI